MHTTRYRLTVMSRKQIAEAAKLDEGAIAVNLKELGYGK